MNIISIIEKKKNNIELSPREVEFFVKGVTDGAVSDMQAAAFLMAVCINGMSDEECFALTDSMVKSGDIVSLKGIAGNTVDKHSSGGVGDSTTFVVMPALAALGYPSAKMSGRGLGHTGGTIDKLEAIKGMRVELDSEEFVAQVNDIGLAVISQSKNICPADKRLYAIRDVTATVDSIPLIAASIMSKKLAGGAKNIVLDVKCGNGAFMKDIESARLLAEKMIAIAKSAGRTAVAVLTRMDEPLDSYIGNSLEIIGALKVLKGGKNRLYEVSKHLAVYLLEAMGENPKTAAQLFDEVIDSRAALSVFTEMIKRQGGDVSMLEENILLTSKNKAAVLSTRSGYISSTDCEGIGRFCASLGAGRTQVGDSIEHDTGLILHVKIGDYVDAEKPIATVFYNKDSLSALLTGFERLIGYSDTPIEPQPDIIGVIR